MDKQDRITIQKKTSLPFINTLIEALQQKYIPKITRQEIVRLLGFFLELKYFKEEHNEIKIALYDFNRATNDHPYLTTEEKKRVIILLEKLKSSFEDKGLGDILDDLTIQDKEAEKEIIFSRITRGKSLIQDLSNIFYQELSVKQISLARKLATITIFGSLEDEQFWTELEKKIQGTNLPPIKQLQLVLRYYGGVQINPFTEETLFTGDVFPFGILDETTLQSIPDRLNVSYGSLGGFVRAGKDTYAVTAAHNVSGKKLIIDHDYIYRGDFNGTYLDVAFLKLLHQGQKAFNPLATSRDPDCYEDYWSEKLSEINNEGNFPSPNFFSPSTEIEKIGSGTGVTRGFLLDAEANALFPDNEEKKRMVAVRWLPNRPFTAGNDSGSIYYAVNGCIRTPIAIHCGVSSYVSSNPKAGTCKEPASFGTRLSEAIEWWQSRHPEFEFDIKWIEP